MTEQDQQLLTIAEAAQLMTVSKSTVRRMILDGDIKTVIIRKRCVRIPEEYVHGYFAYNAHGIEIGEA